MNARFAIGLIFAAALALGAVGCMAPEVESAFAARSLAPSDTVDGVWLRSGVDLSPVRKVVVAIPDVSCLATPPDGLHPEALASVYQELLVEELSPNCEVVYVVRHVDQPLVCVKDLKPYAERIKTLIPTDLRLRQPAPNGDVAILETGLVTVNPGRKWLRYLVGCGAGMTTVQIDGRLRRLGTSESLVEWRDRTGSWMPRKDVDLLYADMTRLARRTGELVAAARNGDAP